MPVAEEAGAQTQAIDFEGCGFLYPYYVGVIEYLIDHYDLTDTVFRAASAASFPVVSYAVNGVRPLKWMMAAFPEVIKYFEQRKLGLFLDSPDFFRALWRSVLVEDSYITASKGHLCLKLTRFIPKRPFVELVTKTTFSSNDDLIDTLVATMHVPGIYRTKTKVGTRAYFDGFFAQYILDSTDGPNVVRVSARAIPGRTHDIVAASESSIREVFSPSSMDQCIEMARKGYCAALAKDGLFVARGWVKKASPGLEPSERSSAKPALRLTGSAPVRSRL